MGPALVAAILAGGCPGGDVDEPDAAGGPAGLAIDWRTAAPVPGPVASGLRLSELHLKLSSVRAIGDAAPGDPRTSSGALELEWNERAPPPLVYDQAPAGLYSQIELGVGGGPEAYELHGEVDLGGTWTPFEIEDEAALAITVPTALTLAAGQRATLAVTLDVAAVLAPIDWSQVPSNLGTLSLTRSDPQIGAVRAALVAAFAADPGVTARR